MTNQIGALVLGGNLRGLSIARSLGRRGIPVWVITSREERLASFSHYSRRILPWIDGSSEESVEYLLRIGEKYGLNGWMLFPTGDESAALLSKFKSQLSILFRVTTPDWSVLRWSYDKRLTHRLAVKESVDHPWTLCPVDEADLAKSDCPFPVILKPAIKASANRFTIDKAWPAENRKILLERYREAKQLVPSDIIMVQERIPGRGESQFSYTALCQEGRPLASLTARRTRQYPVDFGHSSSFVETLEIPEIEESAMRLLAAMCYTGLVEIEFKYDHRNGRYRLLDINPRLWTWSALCGRAGVDYPYLLWRVMQGHKLGAIRGRSGVRWVRMSTDIPASIEEMLRGRLSLRHYLHSVCGSVEFALLALDDPLPGLVDLPLLVSGYCRKIFNAAKQVFRPSSSPVLKQYSIGF